MLNIYTLSSLAVLSLLFASFLFVELNNKNFNQNTNAPLKSETIFSNIKKGILMGASNDNTNPKQNPGSALNSKDKSSFENTEKNTNYQNISTKNNSDLPQENQATKTHDNKNKTNQNIDYETKIKELLLSDEYKNIKTTQNNSSPNYLNDDNFINYSFEIYQDNNKDIDAIRNKYKNEIDYLNIVAILLILYQHANNTEEAMKLSQEWVNKRNEEGKKQILKEAQDYKKLAEELDKLKAPKMFEATHKRLKDAYLDASSKMQDIANAQSDEEMLDALLAYNKSAEKIALALIKISDIISFAGIKIKANEPASMFVFPGMQ